jgi:hypothetical protein
MRWNRYKRPAKFAPADKTATPRPFGGAVPAVQARFEHAQAAAQRGEFPLMASLIYAAPSVIALPTEYTSRGNGMIDRLYQPAAEEKPRAFGEKFAEWFKSGKFQ